MTRFSPQDYSFVRYLEAKKTVDDRALNQRVWAGLTQRLHAMQDIRILELGVGTGSMTERILGIEGLPKIDYTALDNDADSLKVLSENAPTWLGRNTAATVTPVLADAHQFIESTTEQWDVIVAHAFLDLFHLPTFIPKLLNVLRPGGLLYTTINFDGVTSLEPALDPEFDAHLEVLYHRSMDERVIDDQYSGDSRAGRHLFQLFRENRAEILEAGSSDWVVFGQSGRYPADEAYFLHHILHFFESTLTGYPEIDPQRFEAWLEARHAQIERGELVYIAHQIDFLVQGEG